MAGRKTKLTPEVHARVVAHVRAGAYMAHAAEAAGVSVNAVREWIARGIATDDEPYASFASDVTQARAEDAVRNQAAISKAAAAGDWKAAAWNLERKYPDIYGKVEHRVFDVDGSGGFIDVTPEDEAELEAGVIAELRAINGGKS